MLTDETNSNVSTASESACLPIGCAVSAKYRGAFCSAEVKTVERQVKLKVTLLDTGNTIIISEDELVHPVPLRIGNTVLIHSTNSSSSHSRNGLVALVNSNDNHQKQRGTIKQIYDNSVYTVVFNDGDEKSLRRSSLCLQGVRLYQTKIGQQKILEDIPTSSTVPKDQNDITSIVAVRRRGTSNQQVFPALILKRKSLADYIWVRSFLDGREYIVHQRDDVETYKNNTDIQSLCRLTSKQATKACEKFLKYNQIPTIWQKKKKRTHHTEQEEINHSHSSESNVDDSDEETSEEKDSFVAQLFAFMDAGGTPINNIPKIHNCDLDLHRLFKIVRLFGGYNKVTKNDQWGRVYIKMGLPDEASAKSSRAIELAYKKYLFAYEDLSKKLGTMNAPNAYFGSRTSMTNDSRRSLVRVRQQSEEKKSTPIKPQARKRLSIDSKPMLSSTKPQPNTPRRKTIIIKPSLITSESDSSDMETVSLSKKQQALNSKKLISDEKKKLNGTKSFSSSSSLTETRSSSAPVRKSKSTTETENTLKPVIKIPKISYEILMGSTLASQKNSKKQTTKNQDNTSTDQLHKATSNQLQSNTNPPFTDSIKEPDLIPLSVTPVSPSSSTSDEPSSINVHLEIPSIFQTIIPTSITNEQTNEIEILPLNSNKRSYDHHLTDEGLSPSKRSRSSEDTPDKIEEKNSNDPDTGIWKSLLPEDESTPNISYLPSSPITDEIIDPSSSISLALEPVASCLLSIAIPNSPPDNRRTSIRQQKRRTFPTPNYSSTSLKKRTRLDFDNNSNFNLDNIPNSDLSPISDEQQTGESKRCRTVGKRSVKRTVNQPDNEIEEFHLNSPVNITLRQQLEDMFKNRTSRYNFLDLNNNLTGDRRLTHLKDRMRQCQKVFFNLKNALTKIEKQRKIFLRRQKPSIPQPPPPTTTTDLLLSSTCT